MTISGNKQALVYRIVYEMAYGKSPGDLFVCHKCDNPKCIRPTHLFLGTQQDNMADMFKKGRNVVTRGGAHANSKLTEEKVIQIRELLAKRVVERKIANMYNVSFQLINLIKKRKVWTHI